MKQTNNYTRIALKNTNSRTLIASWGAFARTTSKVVLDSTINPVAALDDNTVLRGLLLSYTERVLALEYKVREDAKKVEFYDEVADTTKLLSMDEVSKMLDTGKTRLYHYMRKYKILMASGYKGKRPYQQHMDAGRFEVKWARYENLQTGEFKHTPTPFFTGKGFIWIQQFIAKNGREGL